MSDDKSIERAIKRMAKTAGEEYFSNLESSLKTMMEDVKRHHKGWKHAMADRSYENGNKIDSRNKVYEIEWCMHHVVENFRTGTTEGARAISKITSAFKIEV